MATHKRWDGSAWQDISLIKRWDGSAWQDVASIERWDGTAYVDTGWGGGGGGGTALSATVSPGEVGTASIIGDDLVAEITSEPATTTASGGTAPYTYSWTRISGDSAVFASASTSATTEFTCTIYKGTSRSATFRCTVTDAALDTTTVDVDVVLTR